uniref:XPG-I domain-containing protein n=1 Tax=viral metagenome TaxID=1070528 RepID=A0A6C0KJK8_9ZZZZ
MGVRGLLTYCNPIKRKVNTNVQNLRIGLDGFSLLFLFREEREIFEQYLRDMLAKVGHTDGITLVMDKRAAKEKQEVVQGRKDQRKEAKAEANNLSSFTQSPEFEELDEQQRAILEKTLAQKQRAAWCLYPEYMKWFRSLLKSLEIPIQMAPEEADTVLAKGNYDVVVSSDSDLLILGVKRLWIPELKHKKVQHTEILHTQFINFLGIQDEQLFELAYMAGCDVQPRSLMPIRMAISRLRFYGSIQAIHAKHPEMITSENMDEYARLRRDVWAY